MNKTKIEWCDYTWNPITGCNAGCPYCYARKIYARFGKSFAPEFHHERLIEPVKLKQSSRIFCCSVSDFWGEGVLEGWRDSVLKQIEQCVHHAFIILTKRPDKIVETLDIPNNLWVGVSVTCEYDIWRINDLHANIIARKVVSFEPLIGKMDMYSLQFAMRGIDWVIIGAQTNPTIQPSQSMIYNIHTVAKDYGIPVFMKNNLKCIIPKPREYPKGW